MAKLWGGRFSSDVDPVMEQFNSSIRFDKRMWAQDIAGSKAYTMALERAGILTASEAESIKSGLTRVHAEWKEGRFIIQDTDEDIHTANERRLTEIIGDAGKKMHTGRSRNDQVVTDMRLWLLDECNMVKQEMKTLLEVCCDLAEREKSVLMAGYTHLQPAQPVRFSHWLLSHGAAWQRDASRLRDMLPRISSLPLGSGALAGHAFGVDREFLRSELKFQTTSINSMDSVSDRDFVAEFLWWASLTLTHISQLAEDIIIYNYQKQVHLSDAYSTGSSLMPQKKNPDALELLRGKAGRISGHLSGFLSTLKGLPRTYNKDLQEDKEPLFDTMDTVHSCLRIVAGVLATLKTRPDALYISLCPEMLATDLAEYLVRKGVPFRETHHVSGAAVKMAEDRKVPLSSLTLNDLRTLHPIFEDDVAQVWDYTASVEKKNAQGGTAMSSVLAQIRELRSFLSSL